MDPADKSPTIVVEDTADSLDELSEYLDVLSSSARLKIVKFLEKKPRDARSISHEIETSYENTKKHLDKLMSIGVIKKEAGLGSPTSKGIHPVWQYSLVPGGLESIIRNLGLFSNTRVQIIGGEISRRLESVKNTLSQEVLGNVPAAIVLGGWVAPDVFPEIEAQPLDSDGVVGRIPAFDVGTHGVAAVLLGRHGEPGRVHAKRAMQRRGNRRGSGRAARR